ncbi:hypothetical protein BDN72DRAFT_861877, partial [Pluteus cervinus]
MARKRKKKSMAPEQEIVVPSTTSSLARQSSSFSHAGQSSLPPQPSSSNQPSTPSSAFSKSANSRAQTRSQTIASRKDKVLGDGREDKEAARSGRKHAREEGSETPTVVSYDPGISSFLRDAIKDVAPEFVHECKYLDVEDLLEEYIQARDKEFAIELARLETELGLQSLFVLETQIAHWQGINDTKQLDARPSVSQTPSASGSTLSRKPLSSVQSPSAGDLSILADDVDGVVSAIQSLPLSNKPKTRAGPPEPTTIAALTSEVKSSLKSTVKTLLVKRTSGENKHDEEDTEEVAGSRKDKNAGGRKEKGKGKARFQNYSEEGPIKEPAAASSKDNWS